MPRILIIEDDPFLSDIYLTKFRGVGFEVDVARDGQEGLGMAKEKNPDIILLDIVMPHMDGFAVLRALRSDASLAKIKIILLTNLGQQEDVEKGIKEGADDYIIKAHFTPTEVLAKVQEVLTTKT